MSEPKEDSVSQENSVVEESNKAQGSDSGDEFKECVENPADDVVRPKDSLLSQDDTNSISQNADLLTSNYELARDSSEPPENASHEVNAVKGSIIEIPSDIQASSHYEDASDSMREQLEDNVLQKPETVDVSSLRHDADQSPEKTVEDATDRLANLSVHQSSDKEQLVEKQNVNAEPSLEGANVSPTVTESAKAQSISDHGSDEDEIEHREVTAPRSEASSSSEEETEEEDEEDAEDTRGVQQTEDLTELGSKTAQDGDKLDDEQVAVDETEPPVDGEAKDLDDDEDKKNPAFVPKKGMFYQHDLRALQEGDKSAPRESKKSLWIDQQRRWNHDMFRADEQAPKSRDELLYAYGYDIRRDEQLPRGTQQRKYNRVRKAKSTDEEGNANATKQHIRRDDAYVERRDDRRGDNSRRPPTEDHQYAQQPYREQQRQRDYNSSRPQRDDRDYPDRRSNNDDYQPRERVDRASRRKDQQSRTPPANNRDADFPPLRATAAPPARQGKHTDRMGDDDRRQDNRVRGGQDSVYRPYASAVRQQPQQAPHYGDSRRDDGGYRRTQYDEDDGQRRDGRRSNEPVYRQPQDHRRSAPRDDDSNRPRGPASGRGGRDDASYNKSYSSDEYPLRQARVPPMEFKRRTPPEAVAPPRREKGGGRERNEDTDYHTQQENRRAGHAERSQATAADRERRAADVPPRFQNAPSGKHDDADRWSDRPVAHSTSIEENNTSLEYSDDAPSVHYVPVQMQRDSVEKSHGKEKADSSRRTVPSAGVGPERGAGGGVKRYSAMRQGQAKPQAGAGVDHVSPPPQQQHVATASYSNASVAPSADAVPMPSMVPYYSHADHQLYQAAAALHPAAHHMQPPPSQPYDIYTQDPSYCVPRMTAPYGQVPFHPTPQAPPELTFVRPSAGMGQMVGYSAPMMLNEYPMEYQDVEVYQRGPGQQVMYYDPNLQPQQQQQPMMRPAPHNVGGQTSGGSRQKRAIPILAPGRINHSGDPYRVPDSPPPPDEPRQNANDQ